MKPSRLLYLSAHQMTAYRWHAGELRSEGLFAAGPDGHQEFASYLAQNRDCVFAILANVSEEGFQIETIPFLRGSDRHGVAGQQLPGALAVPGGDQVHERLGHRLREG